MTSSTASSILTDEMLAQFLARSADYDRDNTFFQEDFEDLKRIGYLKLAVPTELGGGGLNLVEMSRETRRLGKYAGATALALNMHVYWTGIAADLWRSGDESLEWILTKAMDGEVFAAGHAESGNDMPLLLSTTDAERVDGGYKIKVGAVAHPMADEHYIAWVELLVDGKSYTQFLSPGNEPEATFAVDGGQVTAREYCTLHGLWKGE